MRLSVIAVHIPQLYALFTDGYSILFSADTCFKIAETQIVFAETHFSVKNTPSFYWKYRVFLLKIPPLFDNGFAFGKNTVRKGNEFFACGNTQIK